MTAVVNVEVPDLDTIDQETAVKTIQELLLARQQERANIVEATRKHAQRHNLCAEVDRALQETGLLGQPVHKEFTVVMTVKITGAFDEAFVNLSPEQQGALLSKIEIDAAHLKNFPSATMSVSYGNLAVAPASLTVEDAFIESVSDVTGPAGVTAPPGYVAGYTSSYGRVVHYWRPTGRNGNHFIAKCGTRLDFAHPQPASARSEERVCAECGAI